MSELVTRPQADKKKIHSKNEFELCYLRHQYLRRVTFNPSDEEMKPYKPIIKNLANNTFFTYRSLFHLVGLESEDIFNIGMTHLVSYLGLFSVELMKPEKLKAFQDAFYLKRSRDPAESDILDKNKANFTLFLKQRFEDVVRVCRQKARNIKGFPAEEFYAFVGSKMPPRNTNLLVEHGEELGFKKIDMATYKSAKKKARGTDGPIFKLEDRIYVAVPIEPRLLNLIDFSGAGFDPYDNVHNMTPEQVLVGNEEVMEFTENKTVFDGFPKDKKIKKIKQFLKENRKNPRLQEEMFVAKKMLREIEAQ